MNFFWPPKWQDAQDLEVDHQPAGGPQTATLRHKGAGLNHAGIEPPCQPPAYANVNAPTKGFSKNTPAIGHSLPVLIDYCGAEKNLAKRPESAACIACPNPKLK